MSWTYTGNPSSSNKDTVRFLVGDTRSDEPIVTDEEILWALSQNSNVYAAASVIADSISTYFSTLADTEEIGPVKVQYTNRVKFYSQKAKELGNKAGTSGQLNVYCGGVDILERELNANDDSIAKPIFTIGMNDTALTLPETEEIV